MLGYMATDEYDRKEERLYRLTVRSLYILALVLNTLVIYEQVKETPEAAIFKARANQLWGKVSRPFQERRHFRRHANQVIYEATTIVEGNESAT